MWNSFRTDAHLSMAASIIVFLSAVQVRRAVELSVFPTLLLLLTLFRLALNIASSRRILLHGSEGTAAAGKVIEAFGQFVVGGNYVVGFVLFLALIVVIWFAHPDRLDDRAVHIRGVGGAPIFSPDNRWIAFATTSLPVPLSPWISTVEFDGATRRTRRITSCIAGSCPIIPSISNLPSSRRFSS